jgi:biotin-dependent carboxylase-like uncharacterized protein
MNLRRGAELIIRDGGALTTVQDLGRPGLARFGVPPSGALDTVALRLANRLVGNAEGSAGLEFHLRGPVIEATRARVVAVLGGRFGPRPGEPIALRRGETLDLKDGHGTPRAVLAVRGGIATEPVLGSRSTCLAAGFGGFEGRLLRTGDRLPLGALAPSRRRASLPLGLRFGDSAETTLRVLPGPQLERLGLSVLEQFCSRSWSVARSSNRTGFRLDGAPLPAPADADSLPPVPTALGTIQLTAAGQPIVLLAERPVTGGYPQLATLIAADLGALVRAPFGATLRFRAVDLETARRALRLQEEQLAALSEEL